MISVQYAWRIDEEERVNLPSTARCAPGKPYAVCITSGPWGSAEDEGRSLPSGGAGSQAAGAPLAERDGGTRGPASLAEAQFPFPRYGP
jgi:hypothetical protein